MFLLAPRIHTKIIHTSYNCFVFGLSIERSWEMMHHHTQGFPPDIYSAVFKYGEIAIML